MNNEPNTPKSVNALDKTSFLVSDEPVMNTALDLLKIIQNTGEIIIKGKGNNCPNAVSVANIITENMLKDNSKIKKIIVDSYTTDDGYMISTIEITITKIN